MLNAKQLEYIGAMVMSTNKVVRVAVTTNAYKGKTRPHLSSTDTVVLVVVCGVRSGYE